MAGDIPSISNAAFQSSTYGIGAAGLANIHNTTSTMGDDLWLGQQGAAADFDYQSVKEQDVRRMKAKAFFVGQIKPQEEPDMANATRRLVQVIIVDPNENIPLDDCILYKGDEKLTDLNDQELFFELDIKTLLAAHNEKRVKVVDKKVKERTEYLEPAKVRDLKMVVVNVATF